MSPIVQSLLAILVAMFLVYVVTELRAARKKKSSLRQGDSAQLDKADESSPWPSVTVMLPVGNEKNVVEELVRSICNLDYPPDSLQILVLDDSTDGTGELAENLIASHRARGLNIMRLRRSDRTGFKAGNLKFGLSHANGEFIAIFDADCLPPRDFLRRVMPCFADKKTGFLQTGVIYHNSEASFLTRFQAMEAGHKDEVTTGYAQDGYMASLTGSSCVWRRACINSIGGISADTITEDVDMGYAAQLGAWKYVYVPDVVSVSELPETMAAFRVQRQRWARGLAHNAVRHAASLFTTPMSPIAKVQALALVFSPMLLALFFLLLLLAPFIAMCTPELGIFFHLTCAVFLAAAIVWGWNSTGAGSQRQGRHQSPVCHLVNLAGYIVLFFPLSLYYFSAIIQLISGIKGGFYVTPKSIGSAKIQYPPINTILLVLEILSLAYSAITLCLGIITHNYWVVLYALLAFGGFTMTLSFSLRDNARKNPFQGHILITGASGSIGAALAREYAAPGVRLTLQGRKREKLEKVAEECQNRGATISLEILDLRQTDQVRAWAQSLRDKDLPDLFIANAGLNTNIRQDASGEPFSEVHDLVSVNLLAVFAMVDGLLPGMRKRKSGQIAIVSSLAAYYGLPHTPAYCATKAALKNWGMALRGWLAPEGIHVNVILPGYVRSPMCEAMPGPKPFLWPPERAAKRIRAGLEKNWARISFPFPLNLGIWGLSILPACLAMPIAKILGYGR